MEFEKVLEEVNEIFRDELDNNQLSINYHTTANDVEEWDSLSHISLIVAIEKHFKIRFKSSEIQGFKNVGEMCDNIVKKLNS